MDEQRILSKEREEKQVGESQMVHGDSGVQLDKPKPPGTAPDMPWVFHLTASGSSTNQITDDVEAKGVHCTGSAVLDSGKIRIFTAAHCLILPKRTLPVSLWLRRDDLAPKAVRFDVKNALTFRSSEIVAWLKGPVTNDPINEDIIRVLSPDPSRPETWRSDFATVDLDQSKWPDTWTGKFPFSNDHFSPAKGDEVLASGGGCTTADVSSCRATSAYDIYADTFTVSDSFPDRFAILPASTTSSRTQFGDSGGPVVAGNPAIHFVGVISSQLGPVTYIQKIP